MPVITYCESKNEAVITAAETWWRCTGGLEPLLQAAQDYQSHCNEVMNCHWTMLEENIQHSQTAKDAAAPCPSRSYQSQGWRCVPSRHTPIEHASQHKHISMWPGTHSTDTQSPRRNKVSINALLLLPHMAEQDGYPLVRTYMYIHTHTEGGSLQGLGLVSPVAGFPCPSGQADILVSKVFEGKSSQILHNHSNYWIIVLGSFFWGGSFVCEVFLFCLSAICICCILN